MSCQVPQGLSPTNYRSRRHGERGPQLPIKERSQRQTDCTYRRCYNECSDAVVARRLSMQWAKLCAFSSEIMPCRLGNSSSRGDPGLRNLIQCFHGPIRWLGFRINSSDSSLSSSTAASVCAWLVVLANCNSARRKIDHKRRPWRRSEKRKGSRKLPSANQSFYCRR